ncbi:nuclear pore complex protein Nup153-like [Sitodiplosis mosellana]|uniref:nuclear pore complex protein Nup153-like n=1 Tax=Sitodiplosis mosellana TaxID=263140 RepID=UPI002444298D|nr:nuclear pore complex protein Nup153-like [Sitodiplosis mosellana]
MKLVMCARQTKRNNLFANFFSSNYDDSTTQDAQRSSSQQSEDFQLDINFVLEELQAVNTRKRTGPDVTTRAKSSNARPTSSHIADFTFKPQAAINNSKASATYRFTEPIVIKSASNSFEQHNKLGSNKSAYKCSEPTFITDKPAGDVAKTETPKSLANFKFESKPIKGVSSDSGIKTTQSFGSNANKSTGPFAMKPSFGASSDTGFSASKPVSWFSTQLQDYDTFESIAVKQKQSKYWECKYCETSNFRALSKCVICGAVNPNASSNGKTENKAKEPVQKKPVTAQFSFENETTLPSTSKIETNPEPAAIASVAAYDVSKSIVEQQNSSWWECTLCLSSNSNDTENCECDDMPQGDTASKDKSKKQFGSLASSQKFSFGSPNGGSTFSFGSKPENASSTTATATATSTVKSTTSSIFGSNSSQTPTFKPTAIESAAPSQSAGFFGFKLGFGSSSSFTNSSIFGSKVASKDERDTGPLATNSDKGIIVLKNVLVKPSTKARASRTSTSSTTNTINTLTTITASNAGNISTNNGSITAPPPDNFLPTNAHRAEKRKSKDDSPPPSFNGSDSNGSNSGSATNSDSNVQIPKKEKFSSVFFEYSEQDCSKKCKHANGLKYHQSRVHGAGSIDGDSERLPKSHPPLPKHAADIHSSRCSLSSFESIVVFGHSDITPMPLPARPKQTNDAASAAAEPTNVASNPASVQTPTPSLGTEPSSALASAIQESNQTSSSVTPEQSSKLLLVGQPQPNSFILTNRRRSKKTAVYRRHLSCVPNPKKPKAALKFAQHVVTQHHMADTLMFIYDKVVWRLSQSET